MQTDGCQCTANDDCEASHTVSDTAKTTLPVNLAIGYHSLLYGMLRLTFTWRYTCAQAPMYTIQRSWYEEWLMLLLLSPPLLCCSATVMLPEACFAATP